MSSFCLKKRGPSPIVPDYFAPIERLARSLQEPTAEGQVSAAQQRQALRELRRTMAKLPVHNPDDGFSNRDHDRLLYGDP